MFQSIRPNSQIYILNKGDTIKVDVGYLTNQPIPKPKYQMPATFGQSQETVVDLIVKVGNSTVNLNNIPAQSDVADTYSDGETLVVSTSREAINSELVNERQKSLDIIKSAPYHEKRAAACDTVLGQLNPEFAEKQSQKEELSQLKEQVNGLTAQVSRLVEALMPKNT
mgnify:CR=1 FL=1